ncbi:MAG TPA: hypothetical protein VHT75_14865 [Acidimicrobiales bacterium]|nr:hypothetical protein [Acidimicrobiales bacterium]
MTSPATTSRDALLHTKLAALVRRRWGADAIGPSATFPGGAALTPASPGGPAFVLVEGATHRSLGGVLAWALRHQAGDIHLLTDARPDTAGLLSRRAEPFALNVSVWHVASGDLRAVEPAPFSPPAPLHPDDAPFADTMRRAGAEPVVEFGVLTAEVLGLEVARVVAGRLEVGVGSQDRLARREVESGRDPAEQLAEVVALIRQFRTPAGSAHLANNLARERWLRAVLVARPDLVGAAWLAPLPPAVPRGDLRTPGAALAAGMDRDDRPVVVAASIGIDLDLVPAAADGRRAAGLDTSRLLLALTSADAHPRTRQLASLVVPAAEVVTVPTGWKGLAGTL